MSRLPEKLPSSVSVRDLTVSYPVLNAKVRSVTADAPDTPKAGWGRIVAGRHAHVVAIDGITFDVGEGERVAILGRNGAGKSTLLQTLGGLVSPNAGSVDIQGEVFGVFNLKQGLKLEATGRRNILLRGLILGKSKAEIDDKMEEIAAFSELGDYLDLPLTTYSSGMIIRLMFSVVAAFDPDVLILDEWIGAVDAPFKQKALDWVIKYTERNRIFILSSHNLGFVKKSCTRGIILDNGRIVEDGPVATVLKTYKATY